MDSLEHVYDDRVMNKTAEPYARAFKWALEEEKQLVLNNVSELLECPVCLTIMSAPIYQCPNGHTLCSMCKSQVKNCCPICRTYMGSIRCLALEKVAKPLEVLALEKVAKPLEVPYNCPCHDHGCRAKGKIPELITHLKNDGDYAIVVDGCKINIEYVVRISNKRNVSSWRLRVYNCYGCYFCLYLKEFPLGNTIGHVAYIRFMGEENEAKKFSYSLENGRDGQNSTYKGFPRSIRVCNENFLNEGMLVSPSLWEENQQERRLKVKGKISQN